MPLIRLVPWLALAGLGIAAVLLLYPGLAGMLGLPGAGGASIWQWLVGTVFLEQQALHRDLSGAVRALNAPDGGLAAAWALIAISFLYGVFHAAGPGHGKAILTTYILAEGTERRRGVLLAVISSLAQGFVAVVGVYGLILLVGMLPRDTQATIAWSERASFVLVALLGGWLVWRAARHGLRGLRAGGDQTASDHHHDHHAHHGHDHGHGHRTDASCGHAHAPDLDTLRRTRGWRGHAAVILSIGLRPCTGAILVLILAHALGMAWAGLMAVLAMSLGTAMAIAALAFATASLRGLIDRAAGGGEAALAAQRVGVLAGLAGGTLLLALGVDLLAASFGAAHPLGL